MSYSDKDLGMGRAISRRDFINGASLAIAGSSVAGGPVRARSSDAEPISAPTAGNYPPALTGLRGSNDAALAVPHALRDGKSFGDGKELAETYDLVVVGGGTSGLAAAYFYRKALPGARILILENHDDVGGHARRNEFRHEGRLILAAGGAGGIEVPDSYTWEGKALLADIGIDSQRYSKTAELSVNEYQKRGLAHGFFFDKKNFGADKLVVGMPTPEDRRFSWEKFFAQAPLAPHVRQELLRLYVERRDYLPGLTQQEKIRKLQGMTYRDYLLNCVQVHPDVLIYFRDRIFSSGAGGVETVSAWTVFRGLSFDYTLNAPAPGFDGLGLEVPSVTYSPEGYAPREEALESISFPDGNATVVKLIIRWLNPGAMPGSTMEDAVTTPLNYGALDDPKSHVRIRLNSTAVNVRHLEGGPERAREVRVTYVKGGEAQWVRAGACIMAGHNAMIPYVCTEIPPAQKEALHLAVRRPQLVTRVLLRNWQAHARLGVQQIHSRSFYQFSDLDSGVSIGGYRAPTRPEEPMVVYLERQIEVPGLAPRDQYRAGRAELLQTSFDTIERNTRDQLARMLAGGGFNPAQDILAITVNRWGHGYACGMNSLFDPDWQNDQVPWVVGRKRYGRIAIANSDAAATPMMQAAFDQAHRAVHEIIGDIVRPVYEFPWSERL